MILVFYIALGISLSVALLILVVYISKLEIDIENLDMSNIDKSKNNEKIIVTLSLKIHNCKWFHFKLNKNKLSNLYATIKKKEYKNMISSEMIKRQMIEGVKRIVKYTNKNSRKNTLNSNINLEKFDAKIFFGTEDYILTSYMVAIAAIIISNILPHIVKEDKKGISKRINYKILPIYQTKNIYKITLNTIINIKISHIIHAINILNKINKQEEKNKKSKKRNREYREKRKVQTV